MLVPICAGVVILIGFIAYGLIADPLKLFAPTIQAYANQDLVVVSDRKMADATVLGHLHRGDAIKGKWTDRRPGRFRWLEVKWPGAKHAYIWGHALSLKPRPDLASQAISTTPASMGSQVFAEPDETSPAVDNLMPGENAVVLGTTSNGWAEISLPVGGVGYVKSASLSGTVDPSAGLLGVTHYVCAISPGEGTNVPPSTPNLSFVFDGNRQCIDHRYAYVADETGGLKRVMFNDKERRVSLLYFTADRHAFQRTDVQLDPVAYQHLNKHGAELASLECPPPGDPSAAAATSKLLAKLMPPTIPQTSLVRRVWRCAPSE